ncbi:Predicted dehydrogenase [Flagellimonas pacifica]|uniref:Predicted dehydrogenase n=2 Tax=Flagellimonas pacifica TaxID=1247520 RepID=A0A285MTV8_9FLAO|nr:Predicted dehydrogenase [Allomuricauda parva]
MVMYKVLVVGCGNMGTSHARAYHKLEQFQIVGLVSRSPGSRNSLSEELGGLPTYSDFDEALEATQPDIVSINTYPETHAEYVKKSLEAKAHVFVEKPIATNVKDSKELVQLAKDNNLKLVVGYILRVHPAWKKFVSLAQNLGKPLVMRMNLNQQSCGVQWETHKNLMKSMSPIVDCGVHYVDIMCLMTQAKPIKVSGIGARLSDEIDAQMYNYGQLQVTFDDGSVGWYEAGWGPMISETAFFVKDVMGPKGSVSIAEKTDSESQNIDEHTQTGALHIHYSDINENGDFLKKDELIPIKNEPSHDELCQLEQEYLLKAIEEDLDLSQHLEDAINSLNIVLAADESFRTGKTVLL